jgi:hypothetical protein
MSDGGIGDPGLTYCATIRISGNLDQAKLKQVIADIENVLKQPGVDGQIESEARVSKRATFDARVTPAEKP